MLVMILSLEKDKERFKTATTALDSFNIPWVKVNAVYGKEVKRDEHYEVFCGDECVARHNFLSKAYYRGHLSDGELGCAMSHLKAYHKLALSDEDGAIIMEDDFIAQCNIVDIVEKAHKFKPDADILYCNGPIKAGLRNAFWTRPQKIPGTDREVFREGIPGLNWFFNRRRRYQGTACYWISKKAAFKLLEIGLPVRFESDVLAGMIAFNKLKLYVINPELGKIGSTLGSSIELHGGCHFY